MYSAVAVPALRFELYTMVAPETLDVIEHGVSAEPV
jgi:hypothetical protein